MGDLKRKARKKRREAVKRLMMAASPQAVRADTSPMALVERLSKQPIIASTPILYSDLMDQIPSEEEVGALITSFKRRPTFMMLCMLNTLLSFYATDIPRAIEVQ